MTLKRQVYLLDPQKLRPETIAVTFAKTSRSPESFREIAAELTDEKSAEFHEKWVVGYGHSSVAEHAVLHIAVENVSRLAVETLESNRLAAYTEKSTRYQKWRPTDFFIPDELEDHPLQSLYIETCIHLLETYQQTLPAVRAVVKQEMPCAPGESEAAWDRRTRSDYIDCCRFLLPAASLANVGMTINARALEHALQKMLSSPLAEVRALGDEIKGVAQMEVPTLVKYANAVPYLEETGRDLSAEAGRLSIEVDPKPDWCRLVSFDPKGEMNALAAALYRFGEGSFSEILTTLARMSDGERKRIAELILGRLGKFDLPIRELEHTSYTFDLLMDQGAYFEFKRHRMMTQSPQTLTTRLGYAVPRRIVLAGMENIFREAMESARQAYEQLAAYNPHIASYIVPNAYNRRVLASFNFRSAYHFTSLRSSPGAHFSIRRIALRVAEEIRHSTPLIGSFLRPYPAETWQDIECNHFAQTA
ncbi:MAG TPA: FAD-dependent thymidylate synthase [Anaerolineaceae bacterium]|nr:FAD-dependent thymidylate synthase [Anaerolineaceae bacterium]